MEIDKRYQVFVSSTYEDLTEERQEIMQALLELDCIPAGMELFPAANEDQWSLIKKVIEDCDYYIVVIGGRYGSIGPNDISYTQMEYEYAVSLEKPVIGFLHSDPSSLPAKRVEKSESGKEKLETFRMLVQQKMCKYWTTPADLGSVVSRSLVKLIKNNPAVGWVKADLLPDRETTSEILSLKKTIEAQQTRIHELEEQSIPTIANLSQGEDAFTVRYTLGGFKTNTWRPDIVDSEEFQTTWNNLFSIISPILIDEASDTSLKKALSSYIEFCVKDDLGSRPEYIDYRLDRFEIVDESLNTIIVQFLALGLISKSSKKKNRSVSDKSSYWMLTTKGESLMIQIRAIKREEAT